MRKNIVTTQRGDKIDATGHTGRYLLIDEKRSVHASTNTRDALLAFAAVLADRGAHAGQPSAIDRLTGKHYSDRTIPPHVTTFLPEAIEALVPDRTDDEKRAVYSRARSVLVVAGSMDGVPMIDDMIVVPEMYQDNIQQ
jgi:hypothetical protein